MNDRTKEILNSVLAYIGFVTVVVGIFVGGALFGMESVRKEAVKVGSASYDEFHNFSWVARQQTEVER